MEHKETKLGPQTFICISLQPNVALSYELCYIKQLVISKVYIIICCTDKGMKTLSLLQNPVLF